VTEAAEPGIVMACGEVTHCIRWSWTCFLIV